MKKVILERDEDVLLGMLGINEPIFAKKNGKLCGIIVQIANNQWVLSLGGCATSTGTHRTRELCMKDGLCCGYEFFIAD